MQTEIIRIEESENIQKLAKIVRRSFELKLPVVVPTETVYGLAAPFNDQDVIESIYKIKNRPSDNPLIVHISNYQQLSLLIKNPVNDNIKKVLNEFWPGPITVLFERSENVPDMVTAGSNLVAIRMPSHRIFKDLIEELGVPLVAPSANLSGKPSPTTAADANEDLEGLVQVIIDGGKSEFGLESTVIKVNEANECLILRPGQITKEMLDPFFSSVKYNMSANSGEKVESPGTKYKHYSPLAKVYLVDEITGFCCDEESSVIITYSTNLKQKNSFFYENEEMLAVDIFSLFRELDRNGVKNIYIEKPKSNIALLNRVMKASEGV